MMTPHANLKLTGRLRVRLLCNNCGYVQGNVTIVYMLPELLDCPRCHKHYVSGQSSMVAVIELPNGEIAPPGIVDISISEEKQDTD